MRMKMFTSTSKEKMEQLVNTWFKENAVLVEEVRCTETVDSYTCWIFYKY